MSGKQLYLYAERPDVRLLVDQTTATPSGQRILEAKQKVEAMCWADETGLQWIISDTWLPSEDNYEEWLEEHAP